MTNNARKISIASDHGGYALKEHIKSAFPMVDWQDYGCDSDAAADYPEYMQKLCLGLKADKSDFGIALCGTGIGASITANRFRNIRAALCHDVFTAEMARRHNNANVLVMGGRVVSNSEAIDIIEAFLAAEFEDGRHQRRLDLINEVSKDQ